MKTIHTLSIAAAIAFSIAGCKGPQGITAEQRGEVEIIELCNGEDYTSDGETFRATATGTSISSEAAKKMARSNADAALAKSISSTMEIVGDNYVSSTKFNGKEEITETFNDMAKTIVSQELRGAVTICNKLTQLTDGSFKYYIAIELSGEQIAQAYNQRLSQDERIKADYNYDNFKKTFDEEMERRRNE